MEKRNRLWRKRHQWRLFRAKMVLFANYPYPHFIDDEGNCIQHPHWFELAKQRWNYHYKSMRTPCSYWLCRGEKYSMCLFSVIKILQIVFIKVQTLILIGCFSFYFHASQSSA